MIPSCHGETRSTSSHRHLSPSLWIFLGEITSVPLFLMGSPGFWQPCFQPHSEAIAKSVMCGGEQTFTEGREQDPARISDCGCPEMYLMNQYTAKFFPQAHFGFLSVVTQKESLAFFLRHLRTEHIAVSHQTAASPNNLKSSWICSSDLHRIMVTQIQPDQDV